MATEVTLINLCTEDVEQAIDDYMHDLSNADKDKLLNHLTNNEASLMRELERYMEKNFVDYVMEYYWGDVTDFLRNKLEEID